MSTYRERQKKKERLKPRIVFISLVYFVVIVVVAYFLSGLVMEELDLGSRLVVRIPLINRGVPQWVFQLALAAIIFFAVQFLSVFVLGLFGRKKKEEELYKPDQYWRR